MGFSVKNGILALLMVSLMPVEAGAAACRSWVGLVSSILLGVQPMQILVVPKREGDLDSSPGLIIVDATYWENEGDRLMNEARSSRSRFVEGTAEAVHAYRRAIDLLYYEQDTSDAREERINSKLVRAEEIQGHMMFLGEFVKNTSSVLDLALLEMSGRSGVDERLALIENRVSALREVMLSLHQYNLEELREVLKASGENPPAEEVIDEILSHIPRHLSLILPELWELEELGRRSEALMFKARIVDALLLWPGESTQGELARSLIEDLYLSILTGIDITTPLVRLPQMKWEWELYRALLIDDENDHRPARERFNELTQTAFVSDDLREFFAGLAFVP